MAALNTSSIMIIDDDEEIRAFIASILISAGYHIYDAVDGLDTLTSMETIKPDLLVLDLMMPQMDGFELLERIRGLGLPVVVVSGLDRYEAEARVKALGASGFLSKPFKQSELLQLIAQALEDKKSSGPAHSGEA